MPWYSAGTQYAAVSSERRHVVPPERSEPNVEDAFVVRLPTNVCRWEAPGFPGKTIGSSGPWWLNRQFSTKFTPRRSARRRSPVTSPAGGFASAVDAMPTTTRPARAMKRARALTSVYLPEIDDSARSQTPNRCHSLSELSRARKHSVRMRSGDASSGRAGNPLS